MGNPLRRREMLVLPASYFAWAAGADEEVIPFADTQAFNPERPRLPWDKTTEWLTPKEHFFHVAHYGYPEVDAASWKLEITGAVDRPRSFTLDDLKKRPRKEHTITLECSGNPPAGGLVGNARWAGTPLAPILKECGMRAEAVDVVFFAADKGTEKIRGGDYPQQFARSLDKADAMKDNVLVCWEMNGAPLTKNHGAPVRLMAPGWYGVAWVKWLERVEVHDRHYLSRFMGRDYVTIRGERRGEQTIWRETSVGRMNLKSVVGRVARRKDGVLNVTGAAWSPGPAIRSVELRIDDGPWTAVKLEKQSNPHAWTFWSHEWRDAKPGEHTLTARATDDRGKVQPSPDDDFIKLKKTYWEANQWAVRKLKI